MASVAARLREEKSTICLFGTCRGGGREPSLKSCCYITFLEAMETRSTAQQPLGVWAAARCCCPVTQRGGVQVLCLTVPLPARALHGAVSARAGICLPPGQDRVPGHLTSGVVEKKSNTKETQNWLEAEVELFCPAFEEYLFQVESLIPTWAWQSHGLWMGTRCVQPWPL